MTEQRSIKLDGTSIGVTIFHMSGQQDKDGEIDADVAYMVRVGRMLHTLKFLLHMEGKLFKASYNVYFHMLDG